MCCLCVARCCCLPELAYIDWWLLVFGCRLVVGANWLMIVGVDVC